MFFFGYDKTGLSNERSKPEVAKVKTPKLSFPLKKQAGPEVVQEEAEAVKNQEVKQEAPKLEAPNPLCKVNNQRELNATLEKIDAHLKELGVLALDLKREGKEEAHTALNNLVVDLLLELWPIKLELVAQKGKNLENSLPLLEESLAKCEGKLKEVAKLPCIATTTRSEEINCLLLNLSLAFAGLLVLYLAAGCANYAVTGRFMFFSQPKAEALTEKLQTAVDDCRKTFEISAGA